MLATVDNMDLLPGNGDDPNVLVLGFFDPGDGGGGLFRWDTTWNGPKLYKGLIMRPTGSTGVWRRVYDGPLSVKWFGAVRGVWDAQPAIQQAIAAAIDEAISPFGNTVYFPPGEYRIERSIVLPRDPARQLTLRGEGHGVSAIDAAQGFLLPDQAVVTFRDGEGKFSYRYRFEGLKISRREPGKVFEYVSEGQAGPEPTRLSLATFRDMVFMSTPDENLDYKWGNQPCVNIVGGQFCRFENVYFFGGKWALRLDTSSFCYLDSCQIGANGFGAGDGGTANGVEIIGGGRHTFANIFLNSMGDHGNPGTGILIDSRDPQRPTPWVLFTGLSGEGDDTHPVVHIRSGEHITFIHSHVSYSHNSHKQGGLMVVGKQARGVRFIGGQVDNGFSSQTLDKKALIVEDGASDVYFDDVVCSKDDFHKQVSLDDDAERVRLNLRGRLNLWRQTIWATNTIQLLPDPALPLPNAERYSVRTGEVFKLTTGVTRLLDGFEGKIVTLLVPAGLAVGGPEPNPPPQGQLIKLVGDQSQAFGPTVGVGTIRLINVGGEWLELSRSQLD